MANSGRVTNPSFILGDTFLGQGYRYLCAVTDFTFNIQLAAMQIDQPLGQRKPQARAFVFSIKATVYLTKRA